PIFPFTEEQVERVARTEPTLRDMLQQYRHLFDHLVFGEAPVAHVAEPVSRTLPAEELPPGVKSVVVVETPTSEQSAPESKSGRNRATGAAPGNLAELWDQETRSARRKLEPEGALTGATRELQSGLGAFLQACHEHGVKVGPWRLQHVVGEWTFGDHPT